MLTCALPGCDGTDLPYRVTDEDSERFYCSADCWDSHVCGLGVPS